MSSDNTFDDIKASELLNDDRKTRVKSKGRPPSMVFLRQKTEENDADVDAISECSEESDNLTVRKKVPELVNPFEEGTNSENNNTNQSKPAWMLELKERRKSAHTKQHELSVAPTKDSSSERPTWILELEARKKAKSICSDPSTYQSENLKDQVAEQSKTQTHNVPKHGKSESSASNVKIHSEKSNGNGELNKSSSETNQEIYSKSVRLHKSSIKSEDNTMSFNFSAKGTSQEDLELCDKNHSETIKKDAIGLETEKQEKPISKQSEKEAVVANLDTKVNKEQVSFSSEVANYTPLNVNSVSQKIHIVIKSKQPKVDEEKEKPIETQQEIVGIRTQISKVQEETAKEPEKLEEKKEKPEEWLEGTIKKSEDKMEKSKAPIEKPHIAVEMLEKNTEISKQLLEEPDEKILKIETPQGKVIEEYQENARYQQKQTEDNFDTKRKTLDRHKENNRQTEQNITEKLEETENKRDKYLHKENLPVCTKISEVLDEIVTTKYINTLQKSTSSNTVRLTDEELLERIKSIEERLTNLENSIKNFNFN